MKDRKLFLRIVLVAVLAATSAIPLGHPPDKEPPSPGVTPPDTIAWYAGHQHNQVLL